MSFHPSVKIYISSSDVAYHDLDEELSFHANACHYFWNPCCYCPQNNSQNGQIVTQLFGSKIHQVALNESLEKIGWNLSRMAYCCSNIGLYTVQDK